MAKAQTKNRFSMLKHFLKDVLKDSWGKRKFEQKMRNFLKVSENTSCKNPGDKPCSKENL